MRPILRKRSEAVVRGEGTDYVIHNYITKENSRNASVAVSVLRGKLWKTMNRISDRVYYIIEGKGRFIFDKEELEADAGDMIYVPAGTPYKIEGHFKAVLVNAPPFSVENEEQLSDR